VVPTLGSYESFFGLAERPFSLTPDTRYFFKSRSHGQALETLAFGLRQRERVLLVTGDLGIGKTVLCRMLAEQLRRRTRVALISSPLMSVENLTRMLETELGLGNGLGHPDPDKRDGAILIIDEAHTLPLALVDHLLPLTRVEGDPLQIVLIGEPRGGTHGGGGLGINGLNEQISTKARLLPLGRDECASYVSHRLSLAGIASTARFAPRAIDTLYGLSGGMPRLLNLLCERALQEAAAAGAHTIDPAAVEAAASALQLLRVRPRRFRWFGRRVS
jgi:MSHA biogenesis protein MshM